MVVALAACAAVTAVAAPAGASRGKIPLYTYGSDCKGFTDPIGILFYGPDASATRSQQLSAAYYEGMKGGDDDSQFFVTHGHCMSTQKSVDNGCFTCNRTHMRIGGLRNDAGHYYRDGADRLYSVATPHTDHVTFDCGLLPKHVNPVNGFRDARRRFAAAIGGAGYPIKYLRLKNTRRRKQCDGSYAQGDGLLAEISTERSDSVSRNASLRRPAQPIALAAGQSVPARHGLKDCPGSGALGFGQFTLGRSFEGLGLSSVLRTCDRPAQGEPYPGRTNVLTYVYGDCDVDPKRDDAGCLPPLQVDSAPACEDNPSLYRRYSGVGHAGVPRRPLRLRSTPAASFDGGRQIEIYTGTTTVTVSGDSPRQVRRAAEALRSGPAGLRVQLNATPRRGAGLAAFAHASRGAGAFAAGATAVAAGSAMPRPAPGALSGRLGC